MRRLGIVLLAILFLFMVFAGPVSQKADAVVLSTVVIGAVIAAMAAAGIGLTVSGMTSAQLQDWVSGKLNEWATSIGGTVQDHIDSSQITTTGRGFLSLGTLAANGISQFISWLQIQDSITDNSTVSAVPGTVTINGLNVIKLPTVEIEINSWFYSFLPLNESDTVYLYGKQNSGYVFFTKDTNVTDVRKRTRTSNGSISYGTINMNVVEGGYRFNRGSYIGDNTALANLYPGTIHNGEPPGLFGNAEPIESGMDYVTGTISIPTIAEGDKWFIDVGADPGATVETATDGVIADTIDGSLTVSGEVAEEEPEFVVNEPIGVSGLTEVFPFCIPFDVYALLSCLSAEPQTPVFTVRFVIPGVINQEFTIDLSPFSTIAQIVRTMELIAFAIGLALVTRERFLRS